jgi:outer membrane protein OmpA-like peptidoglycan-associated protein
MQALPGTKIAPSKRFAQKFIIYYDLDKSNIRTDAGKVADELAIFLKANPKFGLIASSYCDSRATNSYNLRLSERRSESVKNYLFNRGRQPAGSGSVPMAKMAC